MRIRATRLQHLPIALWKYSPGAVVPEAVVFESAFDAFALHLPVVVLGRPMRGCKIHELFKHIAQHSEAIDRGILPSPKQPLLPLGAMGEIRGFAWRAGGNEQGLKGRV